MVVFQTRGHASRRAEQTHCPHHTHRPARQMVLASLLGTPGLRATNKGHEPLAPHELDREDLAACRAATADRALLAAQRGGCGDGPRLRGWAESVVCSSCCNPWLRARRRMAQEEMKPEGKRALAVAENVIKMVVRAFYDDESVVVMDGLLLKTDARTTALVSMREQELATDLKLQSNLVRGRLAQLEKDCLVKSREVKETHGNREQNVQYWWVDHKLALDAIKLRLKRMRKKLEQEPAERKTEYVCESCEDDEGRHPAWDEFEVQELPVPFQCPHCGLDLEEKVQSMDDAGGSSTISKRLEKQLRPIKDELDKMEEMTLPAPRAATAASRLAAKAGEQGNVPGGGAAGADGLQGPQAKKITLSLEGLQGTPAWQMLGSAGAGAAAGPGTPVAATSTGECTAPGSLPLRHILLAASVVSPSLPLSLLPSPPPSFLSSLLPPLPQPPFPSLSLARARARSLSRSCSAL